MKTDSEENFLLGEFEMFAETKMRYVSGLLFFALVISGCSVRYGDFTLVSTKNIGQISQKGTPVKGKDCAYYLFSFIPLGNAQPNVKTATDRALEKAKGDLIVDGVVSSEFFFFPYVWMYSCFTVEGYVAQGEFGIK